MVATQPRRPQPWDNHQKLLKRHSKVYEPSLAGGLANLEQTAAVLPSKARSGEFHGGVHLRGSPFDAVLEAPWIAAWLRVDEARRPPPAYRQPSPCERH